MIDKTIKRGVKVDARCFLLHLIVGVVAIIFIHSTIGGILLFVWCILVQLITKNTKYLLSFIFVYIILTALSYIGVKLISSDNFYFLGLAFTNMAVIGRKAIIPISFAINLAAEPTGALLASLEAMKAPKAIGIALAILLRFFPTIGGEYRQIRSAQKFRGIGVGFLHTIIHINSTIECILIPLILRSTKVAEELAASITVRGVRFSGKTISYMPIHFSLLDTILSILALIIPSLIIYLERSALF